MNKAGVVIWFLIGIFTIVLGWTHFLTYIIGSYLWYAFVEENILDSPKNKEAQKK